MEKRKPAYKSLGVWGSVGSLWGILELVTALREVLANVPPELIDDTRIWIFAVVALGGQLLALIGRWKAVVKIGGLFKAG